MLPGVVIGAPVQPPANPDDLNMTIKPVWEIFSGACADDHGLPATIGTGSVIDVCDVSAIHIWCAEHPSESDGQRYLVTNGRATPQAIADVLRRAYPDRKGFPADHPEKDYEADYLWSPHGMSIDASKAKSALERDFIGFETSVLETAKAFERFYAQHL